MQELQEKVQALSGVSAKQQGRVIFGGKRLNADTVLAEAGVPSDGSAHLNMVPSTTSNKKKKSAATATTTSDGSTTTSVTTTTTTASSSSSSSNSNPIADLLKQSGIDTNELDEMMKSMGGGGGSMQEGMKAMTEAMNSPLFQEMMSDPERLEQSRQMILNNPMLKSMMAGMPGMEDLLNDPVAWRQAMQAAAELYKSMDSDTLMQAMMGGAEAAAGMPGGGGLFDGALMDDSTAAAALDELDEDD